MGVRLYRWLLRVLPGAFRREFGPEMTRVVEEHWVELRAGVGPVGAARFWIRQYWAVAREAARLRFGGRAERGAVGVVENARDGEGWGTMDSFWQDLRHSTRSLARHPFFLAVTVVTLGLGIGSATALFSAVHAVLLRDLPYRSPDRIVAVFHEDTETNQPGSGLAAANARDLSERVEGLSAVAVADPWAVDLQVEGRAESLRAWAVSRGFFEAAGVEALHGRTFLPEEYRPDAEAVALLGHRSWTRRFGADPSIVGETVVFDGRAVRVVGVLPPAFKLPDEAEVWVPRAPQPFDDQQRAASYMTGIGRLAPGASLERVQAEVDRVARSLAESHPRTNATLGFRLVPLREQLFGTVRTPLLVLMGAVGFVLLIACSNVAGLMLARGVERRREYALRSALGAGVGRLVRHVTLESFLIAAGGCLLGIGLTYGGVHVIRSLGPDHLPRIDELRVDGVVLAFAVAAAGLSALVAGLVPSLRLSRPDVSGMLAPGSRGTTGGAGSALRRRLVVLEVAAATVLLVGAGLLFRSYAALTGEELGFDPSDKLALQVFAYDYPSVAERVQFLDRVREEMAALPGVEAVALTSNVPGATDGTVASIDVELPFVVEGRVRPTEGKEPRAMVSEVSVDFFDVMAMNVVEGRGFDRTDDAGSRPVVVVNEELVRRHFPGESPVGQSVVVGGRSPTPREIVGVVADTRPGGFASRPRPEVYRPLAQVSSGSITFVIHAPGSARSLGAAAMETVWSVNPTQAIWGVATLEELLADWLEERTFNLVLLSAFSLVALALALVGVYGLIAFSVEQRVGELGLRRALGGRPGDLLRMVLLEGTSLAAVGVVLGTFGALLLTRFLQGMLYGVEPTDPATFGALALLMMAAAGLAALLPALRAVRVDPMVALRSE